MFGSEALMVQVIDRAFDILELLATAGDAVSLSHRHCQGNFPASLTAGCGILGA